MDKIKISIVEDLEVIRNGLAAIINMSNDFTVLHSFETAEKALPVILSDPPDIVIMDIHLPGGMNGIECIKKIKEKNPDIRFMMFTIYENSDTVFQALEAGAAGYLLKNTTPSKILESLKELYEGGAPMNAEIAKKLVLRFQQVAGHMSEFHLTEKERQILNLVSKGYLYKEIACELNNSINTIKQHIRHIYEKLHVQNKAEAINKIFLK
ncbi:MAG TPA: response regulator transcription factor [Chitinophagaceae bacterium]|nr:response regulator transcription factor [Chitinophagaceae bacterium]